MPIYKWGKLGIFLNIFDLQEQGFVNLSDKQTFMY